MGIMLFGYFDILVGYMYYVDITMFIFYVGILEYYCLDRRVFFLVVECWS